MISRRASPLWHKSGLLMLILSLAVLNVSASIPYKADGPLMIAHRGASGYAPENTMAAFQLAERLDADFIELDVRLSKDKEVVVMHDPTVDRTTDYIGYVNEYTWRELQAMDAGSYYNADYAGESILSLQEVMERFAGRIGILIEIKDPLLYPGIEERVADVVLRYSLPLNNTELTGIIIQSFDSGSLQLIHTLLPDIPVARLIHKYEHPLSEEKLDELAAYASYINCNYQHLDEELVHQIHVRNMKVMAWTLQYDRDMKRLKRLGIDGIITDNFG